MSRAEAGKPDVNKIPGVRSRKANEQSVTSPINQVANPTMEVNEMWFKSWFLNALRDDEIKGVIKQITADAVVSVKVQVPDGKVVELERELASKTQCLKAAEDQSLKTAKQLECAERERDKAKAKQKETEQLRDIDAKRYEESQSELRSVKGELKKLQGLASMAGAYERYQRLSVATRKTLNGVINGKDLLSFVCTGSQESNLERFWDLCNEAFIDGDEEASEMSEVFDAFFELTLALGTLNKMERLSVESGDRFDNDLCTRIARSAPTGCVSDVLFQGYRYVASKKIVKKSLVRV